ncbi:hypothetical protein TRIP_B200793 [uncultured Desulfatiglans sp.]|nr:hypothetical protein TRIP_B200793 [uncultured Desulfatiglans sp.]
MNWHNTSGPTGCKWDKPASTRCIPHAKPIYDAPLDAADIERFQTAMSEHPPQCASSAHTASPPNDRDIAPHSQPTTDNGFASDRKKPSASSSRASDHHPNLQDTPVQLSSPTPYGVFPNQATGTENAFTPDSGHRSPDCRGQYSQAAATHPQPPLYSVYRSTFSECFQDEYRTVAPTPLFAALPPITSGSDGKPSMSLFRAPTGRPPFQEGADPITMENTDRSSSGPLSGPEKGKPNYTSSMPGRREAFPGTEKMELSSHCSTMQCGNSSEPVIRKPLFRAGRTQALSPDSPMPENRPMDPGGVAMAILSSFLGTTRGSVLSQLPPTEAQTSLEVLVHQIADRIGVLRDRPDGQEEVRITLKDAYIVDTEIRIRMDAGSLQVGLLTTSSDAHALLSAAAGELAHILKNRIGENISVSIHYSETPEDRPSGQSSHQHRQHDPQENE